MQRAEFEERYCIFRTVRIAGGRTIQVPVGGQNIPELRAKLAAYMTRLRRADTLDLPSLRIETFALSIEPNAALIDALREVPKELLEQLQAASDDELMALLRRYAQQLSTLRRVLGLAKAIPAADHLAERLAGGETRVIGFFHHRQTCDAMAAELESLEIDVGVLRGDTPSAARGPLIDRFDRGNLPVLLLQSQSGSLGLNLQSCRYAAIVEPDWTAATTEQAIARLYRAGQQNDVFIDFLLIPDSLDEHIVGVARRKAAIAAGIIERQPQPEKGA
jgi:SNF2 family DNA or RNA helicase